MSKRQDGYVPSTAPSHEGLEGDRFQKDKYDHLRLAAMQGALPTRTDLSFQDRLKFAHLRLFHEIDDARIEEVIGRSEKQLARYTSGSDIPVSVLLKIAEWSRVPLTWILENELMIADRYALPGSRKSRVESPQEIATVPFLNVQASAGTGTIVESEESTEVIGFLPAWLKDRGINPVFARALTVRGDSMEPTIRSGDIILIDASQNKIYDNGIYVIVSAGFLLVKRVHPRRDGSLLLISDNNIYPREEVSPNDPAGFHIAGRVMWYGRAI